MVVAELDVIPVAVGKPKADPPLIVDRDGMLPRSITFEGVQPIPWRHAQIRELRGNVDGFKLPQRSPSDIRRHLLRLPRAEELLGLAIGEGLDHAKM
jgi:hypothetical protein